MILGQDGSGSFALADSLQGATNAVIDARLREIRDQLNHDLIPQLFALNGWDTSVTPYFDFDDFKEISIDDFSKALQRIASVGLLVRDAAVVNAVHKRMGLPIPFDKTDIPIEEVMEKTTPMTSRSGDGMKVGKISGTGGVASKDTSAANMEN